MSARWRKEWPATVEVDKESVYWMLPKKRAAAARPVPPPFRNHGNDVISVAELWRAGPAEQAEEAGAYILTETSATQLLVEDGRVMGVRSGDKGRGKDGEPLGNFEPGTDLVAKATVLGEGCWGHLTGAAIREFDLGADREPPGVGARGQGGLGGRQAAGPPDPHARALAAAALVQVGRVGGTWIYPMKDERRRRPGLDRLRRRPGVRRRHDVGPRHCSSCSRPTPGARDPRGRQAGRLGRQGHARRGLLVDAQADDARARCWSATPAGWWTPCALKGMHHAIRSGMLAAESIYRP